MRFHVRRGSYQTQIKLELEVSMISQQAPLATRFMGNLPGGPLADQSLELDERQLVLASQQGDIAAYGALVRKYQDQLCSALRYMCGSFSDAQDAAQEA